MNTHLAHDESSTACLTVQCRHAVELLLFTSPECKLLWLALHVECEIINLSVTSGPSVIVTGCLSPDKLQCHGIILLQ